MNTQEARREIAEAVSRYRNHVETEERKRQEGIQARKRSMAQMFETEMGEAIQLVKNAGLNLKYYVAEDREADVKYSFNGPTDLIGVITLGAAEFSFRYDVGDKSITWTRPNNHHFTTTRYVENMVMDEFLSALAIQLGLVESEVFSV